MTSARAGEASFYDVYPVALHGTTLPAGQRPSICFWNLSGRDVVLKVEGQTQTIPLGGRTRMNLEGSFVWQVVGHEPRSQDLAAGAPGLEIVLRR
jgi:hypothetical protein